LFAELMTKSLTDIGSVSTSTSTSFPELLKAEKQCRTMMRGAAWIADYPDGDNFMQLLYGPNTVPEQHGLLQVLPTSTGCTRNRD
jgi:ABC-type oligopeptide transport system substrate-binding subunit